MSFLAGVHLVLREAPPLWQQSTYIKSNQVNGVGKSGDMIVLSNIMFYTVFM